MSRTAIVFMFAVYVSPVFVVGWLWAHYDIGDRIWAAATAAFQAFGG